MRFLDQENLNEHALISLRIWESNHKFQILNTRELALQKYQCSSYLNQHAMCLTQDICHNLNNVEVLIYQMCQELTRLATICQVETINDQYNKRDFATLGLWPMGSNFQVIVVNSIELTKSCHVLELNKLGLCWGNMSWFYILYKG